LVFQKRILTHQSENWNGGIEEPEYTNEESMTLTGSGPQNADPVLQWILDFLEDCLNGQVALPVIGNALGAAIENTNMQIESVMGPSVGGEDLYYMKFYYAEGNSELQVAPQYNGNISWMDWQVSGESAQQYGFTYDGIDRLTKAKYLGVNAYECFPDIPAGAYDVPGITYDKLGNIETLLRNGMTNVDFENPTFGQIDNLTYTYSGTSLLSSITDVASPDKGFKASGSSYSHDATGNLTSDSGKGLNAGYNFIDLPYYYSTSDGSMSFVYDANGMKLKQIVVQNGVAEEWLYLDGVEMLDGALHTIHHSLPRLGGEAGRIVYDEELPVPGGGDQTYAEWFLKDHLGNTRVRFVDKNGNGTVDLDFDDEEVHEITGCDHYYPFRD
jgi:hypothetical protein